MKKPKLSDFTSGVHQIEYAQAVVQKYQKALENYIKYLEDPKNQVTAFTIKALSHALKDPEYRLGWVANIAMAYLDNQRWYRDKNGIKGNQMSYKNRHAIANQAAEYFLDQLTKDRS